MMRLNTRKRKMEMRYIVLIIIMVVTFFIAILSFTIKDDRPLSPIEGFLKDGIVTLQSILYAPFRYIDKKIDEINLMKEIYNKYKDNYDKEAKYELIKTENEELKREINQMKSLLDINNSYTDYQVVNSAIVNRNVGEWYNTITIDKGRKSGIKEDMIVVNSQGLIGRIIKTTNYTSDVKLITTDDLNNKISVGIIVDNDITYGLLSGFDYQKGYLTINDITDNSIITKGDRVITSGLSNLFPKGVIIGKVEEVIKGEFGLAKTIIVKPTVDFNDLRFVSVLIRKDIK